ncbi:MarR family winged helix-turn-helix transcriptional regulator [Paenibacillus nicotianae]|uniref:MarR family winged helix-turn-helix transcriptional regulator n=1 Tax=Paenibacillus nicotianae TaxID=1526551 RepID=A0ABW4V1I6_9BACL
MVRKHFNEQSLHNHQLPKLGKVPYDELCKQTSAPNTSIASAQLGLLMLWTSDHILDIVDNAIADYDITESKLDLLLLIQLHENSEKVTPSAIAERLNIRRASVTALLNSVEKKGWIIRESSLEDGRKIYVKLSATGTAFVQRILPVFWSACASLVEGLSEEEQQLLSKVIEKLHTQIEQRFQIGR